jgi:Asp-tRNA(Asn)/Glu-tRNA(Gln) amidotransferase B subunit
MKTKIKITESQLARLKELINENTLEALTVKKIKEELDANYIPSQNVVREGGEFHPKTMVLVKANEELISVANLYEYLKGKYKLGEQNNGFMKQVIKDWVHGKINDNYQLSRPIALM